jgi:hypothetical protein
MLSRGENEPNGSSGDSVSVTPIILWDKRKRLAGHRGMQHRIENQPLLADVGLGLEEHPYLLLHGLARREIGT